MDQFLAEYYGTAEPDAGAYADDDLEKMAQLTLLTKEAAAEGVDLSQFTDEELLAMADDLYGDGGYEPDFEKEAQAKFEEADFLGRIMAHSFNQELGEIEKQAGWVQEAGKRIEGAGARVGEYAGKAWRGAKKLPGQAARAVGRPIARGRSGAEQQAAAEFAKKKAFQNLSKRQQTRAIGRKATQLQELSATRRGAAVLGGAAALGAGGAGAAYAMDRRKKQSSDSAFDQLVIDRANEHLAAAGLIEKQAGEEDFDTIVDRAALELLEANGYPVEWY